MDISALLRPKRREPVRGELLTPMAAAGAAVSGAILLSSLVSLQWIRYLALIFGAAGFIFLLIFLLFRRKKRSLSRRVEFPALFLLAFMLGMLLAGKERTELLAARVFDGQSAVISGTVSQPVRRAGGKSRFLIKNAQISTESGVSGTADVLFYSDGELSYDGGEKTVLRATPSSDLTLSQIGMGGQLIVYRAEFIRDERNGLLYPLYRLRARVLSRIQRNLRQAVEKEDAGLLSGFLFGSREMLSDRDDIRMQGAGLAHLLAVSGLHVAIFFSLTGLLLRPFGRRAALWGSIPITAGYVFLTGSSVSSVRALMMLSMIGLAELCRYPKNTTSILGSAAFFFCLFNPNCVFQIGTILSFLSVFCIYAVSPLLYKEEMTRSLPGKFAESALQNASISLCISVATLPVMTLLNGFIPLLAPVCSLLVLPVMPVALVLGLMAAVLGGSFPGKLVGIPARLLIGWIRFSADLGNMGPKIPLGGALLRTGTAAVLALLTLSAVICGIRRLSLHRKLFASLTAFLVSLTAFLSILPQPQTLTLSSLEGALILQKGTQAMLIGSGKSDYAGNTLAKFLRANGILSYTLLIPEGKRTFSGGAYTLCGTFPPEKILTADPNDSSLRQALDAYPALEDQTHIITAAEYRLFDSGTLRIRPSKEGLSIELYENDHAFRFRDKDAPDVPFDGITIYYDAQENFPASLTLASPEDRDIINAAEQSSATLPSFALQNSTRYLSNAAEQSSATLSSFVVQNSAEIKEMPGWKSGFLQPDWQIFIGDELRLSCKSA